MSFSLRSLLAQLGAPDLSRGARSRSRWLLERGIALESSGRTEEALKRFRDAVEGDSTLVPAHMGLARAYLAAGRHSDAEERYRAALKLHEANPDAYLGLADVLEAMGRDQEALSAIERAIVLRGDDAVALLKSISLLRKLGRMEAATALCERVLELEPENSLAHGTLGIGLLAAGRTQEAESRIRQALAFDPDYAEAKLTLANVLQATGRKGEAVGLLVDLASSDPTNAELRRTLGNALDGFALRTGRKERSVLLTLCVDDGVSMLSLAPSIVASIKGAEGFRLIEDSMRDSSKTFDRFDPYVVELLRDSILIAALPRMPITDISIERVLTYLRRWILCHFDLDTRSSGFDANMPIEFIAVLARHCHFTGYAFLPDSDEIEKAALLRAMVEGNLRNGVGTATLETALTVFALYESLHTLSGFGRLTQPPGGWSWRFQHLVREQVENFMRESEIAREIAPITTISDEISLAVRAQYEENPYPRWVTSPTYAADTFEGFLQRLRPGYEATLPARPLPILIAGCGTGHVPVQFAKTFPDADILAVDLSLKSLSYAERMTQDLKISTIAYRQGDILQLGALHKRFAIIDCTGVLHHLRDPMAGWRVLVELLEPYGLMKIGLYSQKARFAILAAREYAASLGLPGTSDGIRRCRREILNLPDQHPARGVVNYADFYVLDGCRDMIMHVQEHEFTFSRIAQSLDELGLRFLGIQGTPTTQTRFKAMFPESGSEMNLEAWDHFENAYPETFIGMYQFWCCKN